MSQPGFGWRLLRRLLAESRLFRLVMVSRKGRLSGYVSCIEPHLRLKRSRHRWVPPWIVCITAVPAPNSAIRDLFTKYVFFIDTSSQPILDFIGQRCAYGVGGWQLRLRKSHPVRFAKLWEQPHRRHELDRGGRRIAMLLDEMQIEANTPFVLLATRDSAYYKAISARQGSAVPGPEILEDTWVRNPSIDSYREACRMLVSRGFAVIRVGVSQSPLSSAWDGVATDYATRFRTDERDVLLARHCHFLLNGATGTWALTALFNKPHVSTNCYLPLDGTTLQSGDIFSQQLRRVIATERLQTFREMIATAWKYTYEGNLRRDGIELVKNSPEDIVDLVGEMLARLDGTFRMTKEDRKRRERFEEIRSLSTGVWERGNIGMAFLRRYEQLLD